MNKEQNVFKIVPTASFVERNKDDFGLVFKAGDVSGDLLTISSFTNWPSVSTALWVVADQEFPNRRLEVTEGDYIRFGAQVIRVSKVRPQSESLTIDQQNQLQRQKDLIKRIKFNDFKCPVSLTSISEFVTGSEVCRVCLEGGREMERQLCKCNGLKTAHKECLRSWVFAKVGVKVNSRMTYYDFTKLSCHQCSQRLNFNFAIEEITELVGRPHVMFEVLSSANGSVSSAYCAEFMDGDDQFVTVGRSKRNDVVLKDLTVSREHAKLWWLNGHIYLYDCNSLYGTAGLVSRETDIFRLSQFKLTIGPYLVRLQLETVDSQSTCAKVNCAKSKQKESHFQLPKAHFQRQNIQLLTELLDKTPFLGDMSCNVTQPALTESEVLVTSRNPTMSAERKSKATKLAPPKDDVQLKENRDQKRQSKQPTSTKELLQKRPRAEYPLIVKSHLNTVRMQLLASKQQRQEQTRIEQQTGPTLLSLNEVEEKRSKGPLSIAELLDTVVLSPRRISESELNNPSIRRSNCMFRNVES